MKNTICSKQALPCAIIALVAVVALVCGSLAMTGCTINSSAKTENIQGGDIQGKTKEYAQLLITKGVNIKPGDTLALLSSVETADFANLCIDAAYSAGASRVIVLWNDQKADQMRLINESEDAIGTASASYAAFFDECLKTNASYLRIESPDPTASEGVSTERLTLDSASKLAANAEYDELRTYGEVPWTVAGYPNTAWAEQVFPDKKGDDAVLALLDAILKTAYVSGDGNASQAWNTHLADLSEKSALLNDYNFATLHYKNSAGTDLTVEMPEGHSWITAGNSTPEGRDFVENIPTEEVYSAPMKTGVNGTLVASKPLVLNGQVVEGVKLIIEDGKITEATSSTDQDLLNATLDADEGGRYLGEISLVPYDSPISQTGLLFYSTLYDENASCHFAFGDAYPTCLVGGNSMDEDELLAHGLNRSSVHVDFMVGTSDLEIIGTTHDGTVIQVFRNGNFSL